MVAVTASPQSNGAWALACGCGWSDSVQAGFRTTSARTKAIATENVKSHLRAHHGVVNCLVRHLPGKVREFSGINEKLLDQTQAEQFGEILAGANFRGNGGSTARPAVRMKIRDGMKTYAAFGLWLLVLAGAFYLMLEEDKIPEPHPDPFLWLMVAVLLFGWIPAIWVLLRETEAWRRRVLDIFLESIDFEQRDPKAVRRGYDDSDDGPHYWATGNYDPERYYRETRGWSEEYRDYVRDAYGDLDTYEANKPD